MTRRAPPPALVELQADFTQLLRTPLTISAGRLVASESACPTRLRDRVVNDARADATARLAVYQRQYWMRLFTVMQADLLLTSRVIGAFTFNRLAARYLCDHAPRKDDIGRVADGFEPWLLRHRALLSRWQVQVAFDAVVEALAIDTAYRRAWLAPLPTRWTPSAEETATLPTRQLRQAEHATLVEEHWALVAIRQQLLRDPSPEHVQLGEPAHRHWAIVRTESGFGQLRLEPRQAALYRECARRPLQDAIATLQRSLRPSEQAAMSAKVRQWFADGLRIGLWCGADP